MKNDSLNGAEPNIAKNAMEIARLNQEIKGLVSLFNANTELARAKCIELLASYTEIGFIHYVLARCHNKAGEFELAVESYNHAIELEPSNANFPNHRGVTYKNMGRDDEALKDFEEAILLDPSFSDAHHNKAIALLQQNKFREAVVSFDSALKTNPQSFKCHYDKGIALRKLGLSAEAAASYQAALSLNPNYTVAHCGLGNVYRDMGDFKKARESFEKAISLLPTYAQAFANLGVVLEALGLHKEAIINHKKSVDLQPNSGAFWDLYAVTLTQQKRFEEALPCYQKAIDLGQNSTLVWSNQAAALRPLGRYDEAISSCRMAIKLSPQNANAYLNMGNSFRAKGEFEQAIACYDQAIELKKDDAAAWKIRGEVLYSIGRLEEAVASFKIAATIDQTLSFSEALALPTIPDSVADITKWRARYLAGIRKLERLEISLQNPEKLLNYIAFHLAYHNMDNKEILEALSALFRAKAPKLNYTARHIGNAGYFVAKNDRTRVGVISEFLVDHTIGKLYQGYVSLLDPEKFEVVLIRGADTALDAFGENLNSMVGRSLMLPHDLEKQKALISELSLDILFYPDIGMSARTYLLAHTRLAPIQVVSWGHPDTTGIDTIDYFISSELIEDDNAEKFYSENLIRLSQLPCYYKRPVLSDKVASKKSFGLPESGSLYGCPQALFKFHPDFDDVLTEIVTLDPSGHIVLIEGKNESLNELLKKRWKTTHPELLEKVILIPRQPNDRFLCLMAQMDVLLDPIYFGSGNTMYEAISLGIPIITWPSKFMRGKIVAGAYKQMKVDDAPIASCPEEYAALAVAFAQDVGRQKRFKKSSNERANKIFEVADSIRELETFFEKALEVAKCGERLPSGWRPCLDKEV